MHNDFANIYGSNHKKQQQQQQKIDPKKIPIIHLSTHYTFCLICLNNGSQIDDYQTITLYMFVCLNDGCQCF
jgi:hypothetical protein